MPRTQLGFTLGILAVPLVLACGGSDDGSSPTQQDLTAPPDIDCKSFELELPPWTVQPGENTDYCMRLPMPDEWLGRDLALTGWSWNLSLTHHFFMEYSPMAFPGTTTDPIGCGIGDDPRREFSFINSANAEGSRLAFGAGQGAGSWRASPGVGKYLPASGHFRTSHHVINTSTEPVTTYARFNVCLADAATIPYLANTLVCTSTAIDVPAGQIGTTTATCTAPFDMNIVLLASHAHAHLRRFTVHVYDGTRTLDELAYESTDWDSPQINNLDTPIRLKAGQGLTYTCEYQGEARFSSGAEEPWAEHCAVFSAYTYPEGREYEIPPPMVGLALQPNEVSTAIQSPEGSPI
jgi:hypothetical protein